MTRGGGHGESCIGLNIDAAVHVLTIDTKAHTRPRGNRWRNLVWNIYEIRSLSKIRKCLNNTTTNCLKSHLRMKMIFAFFLQRSASRLDVPTHRRPLDPDSTSAFARNLIFEKCFLTNSEWYFGFWVEIWTTIIDVDVKFGQRPLMLTKLFWLKYFLGTCGGGVGSSGICILTKGFDARPITFFQKNNFEDRKHDIFNLIILTKFILKSCFDAC